MYTGNDVFGLIIFGLIFISSLITIAFVFRKTDQYHSPITRLYRSLVDYKERGIYPVILEEFDQYLEFRDQD